jgi:hypothetical protein
LTGINCKGGAIAFENQRRIKMSDDKMRDKEEMSTDKWDRKLHVHADRERVAGEIINLLAERNVCIADVDRIFSSVKSYIGVIPLGEALPIMKREICGAYTPHE